MIEPFTLDTLDSRKTNARETMKSLVVIVRFVHNEILAMLLSLVEGRSQARTFAPTNYLFYYRDLDQCLGSLVFWPGGVLRPEFSDVFLLWPQPVLTG